MSQAPGNDPAAGAAGPAAHATGAHGAQAPTLWLLTLGALGVVYGDIGTSPLYAFRECILLPHGAPVTEANVLGILSLFFWSLVLGVTVKYLFFVLRADNHGEGGTLALLSLALPRTGPATKITAVLMMVGLFGTSLLAGDGFITPAISVLGAMEGLSVATKALEDFVVPITIGILVGLFMVQRRGTGRVGAMFGPVMIVWFTTLAALGVWHIARYPAVLWAMHPAYAVRFFAARPLHNFLILGSVFLCLTGGEALYADMGHFGREPIRRAWLVAALPALLLNYFGQGALVLADPTNAAALANPFYAMAPGAAVYPLLVLATMAAVIASQALISGMFSVVQQAIALGLVPRMKITHTAAAMKGQIYVPFVNWLLCFGCIALVLAFRGSSNLAAAYGIAVTGTMATTSVLFAVVAVKRFGWSLPLALLLAVAFLVMDLSFFAANAVKFLHGGWFPIAVGAVVLAIMTTWKAGRAALARFMAASTVPIDAFLESFRNEPVTRVKGTAVFMSSSPQGVPPVLLHHLKHNKSLHEQVLFLSVVAEDKPHVPGRERVEVTHLGDGFHRVIAHYGFMQRPHVQEYVERAELFGVPYDPATTSYYLGRETLLTTGASGLSRWRKKLFAFLSRNAPPVTSYFGLPANRVVEMGTQVEL